MEPEQYPFLSQTRESEEHRVENTLSFLEEYALQCQKLAKEITLKEEAVKTHTLQLRKKEEELVKAVEERKKKVEFLDVYVTKRLGVLQEKEKELDKEIKKQTLELEMKEEELVKVIEERENKVELLEVSVTRRLGVLEEKEKEFDLKQIQEAEVIRLILEKQNEEVVTQHKDSMIKKHEEVLVELKAAKEEVCLISKSVNEKSCELERTVKEFEMKQVLETESRRKEAELMEKTRKKLERRENELNEAIEERLSELEEKEEMFEVKKREETRKIEEKSKLLELKEKKLDEKERQLALKRNEIKERLEKAMARKRSRHEAGTSSLAHDDRDSDSLNPSGKRHKPVREHSHNDEESVPAVSAKTRHDQRKDKAKTREVEEVFYIDSNDEEELEPITCPDPDFHHFTNTMECFSVGQIWALYEPRHLMPRYYAVIKRIMQPELSLRVEWLEPEQETRNGNNIACGDFTYGEPDTQSYMAFSHEMHYTKQGKTVTINPRKGETWALFSDGNNQREHGYEFVEVITDFNSDRGIGLAYLESVEGFASVYKRAEQQPPLSQILIPADEMNRFSHRVPSFKLTGAEKEGVPSGSFELDPAAIPRAQVKDK